MNEIPDNEEKVVAGTLHEMPKISQVDPAKILAYFCACHRWRVYPPDWIMNELYSRFSEYLDDNLKGKARGLGEYFGEPARGTRPGTLSKLAQCRIMEQAMMDVDRFHEWFGINCSDAFDLVAHYLEAVESRTSHRFEKSYSFVKKAYDAWQKSGASEAMIEYWKGKKMPTRADKVAMLRRYPRDAFDGYPQFAEYL
jgi:hypothetical protein